MIGGRYGSVDLDGVGFTEKEYDYAISQGKPVMAFLHGHPEKLAIDVSDVDPEARNLLEAFREKVKRAKHVKFWETAQDLTLHVLQSFSYFVKAYLAVGWVRGDAGDSPRTLARMAELQEKVDQLEAELAAQATQPPSGAAGLADGEQELDYDCTIRIKIRNLERDKSQKASDQSLPSEFGVSWNEILFGLGPLLIEEADKRPLSERFGSVVRRANGQEAYEEALEWITNRQTRKSTRATLRVLAGPNQGSKPASCLMKQASKPHFYSYRRSAWSCPASRSAASTTIGPTGR
jgi:hypothetical protein